MLQTSASKRKFPIISHFLHLLVTLILMLVFAIMVLTDRAMRNAGLRIFTANHPLYRLRVCFWLESSFYVNAAYPGALF